MLDNGSHSIKLAHASIQGVLQVPNCIARSKDDRRLYIGHQLDEKHLLATLQYRRPHERVSDRLVGNFSSLVAWMEG